MFFFVRKATQDKGTNKNFKRQDSKPNTAPKYRKNINNNAASKFNHWCNDASDQNHL